jgi:hypothetical protein
MQNQPLFFKNSCTYALQLVDLPELLSKPKSLTKHSYWTKLVTSERDSRNFSYFKLWVQRSTGAKITIPPVLSLRSLTASDDDDNEWQASLPSLSSTAIIEETDTMLDVMIDEDNLAATPWSVIDIAEAMISF